MEVIGLMVYFVFALIIVIPTVLFMWFFIRKKGLYAINILMIFILIGISFGYLELVSMENNIYNKSIERFGIEPEYIDINFDMLSAGKTPHSIVRKDGKAYYWSFQKNDFVFYYTYVKNRWKESTSESVEKLFNQYVFNKEEKK